MKPVSKIYPTSQNLLGSQVLRNDTPKPFQTNKMNNPQNSSFKNALNQPSNNNIGNQEDFLVETGTQNNNNNNNQVQLSPTSNKSYQKMSGFKGIEELKKRFLSTIDAVVATRLVEYLGGLARIDEKVKAVERFAIIWRQLLDILGRVTENIELMNFDQAGVVENSEQLISEVVAENVKEMESQYLDLIMNSALRFLDTVCTVHDIQYKQLINLRFDIRSWKKNNIDHIKSSNPKGRQLSMSENFDEGNPSLLRSLCSCCFKSQQHSSQIKPQVTIGVQSKI